MELISTFFTLPRGLVYHHQRILKLILNLDLLIYFLVSNDKKISQKLKFSNTYIFATLLCKPMTFLTLFDLIEFVDCNIKSLRNRVAKIWKLEIESVPLTMKASRLIQTFLKKLKCLKFKVRNWVFAKKSNILIPMSFLCNFMV